MDLKTLMLRISQTIARDDDDMYLGDVRDFPLVKDWLQIMDLPVTVVADNVLLRFKPAKKVLTRAGTAVNIVSRHAGMWYGQGGQPYRGKDLIFL